MVARRRPDTHPGDRAHHCNLPPRRHKHRYCGVLAPSASLRKAVIESAGPAAARCWALLLVRVYECLPQLCPSCGHPMRIFAFLKEPPLVQKILLHIGEPIEAPEVLPGRGPPQRELEFDLDVAFIGPPGAG